LKSVVSNDFVWLGATPLRVEADYISETLFCAEYQNIDNAAIAAAVSVMSRLFRIKLSSDEVTARCQLLFITDISATDKQI
jgi:hypothetical protein